MLSAGTILGRYEIRSHLGSGGMGEVYLARDLRLDRDVALKILPVDVAADPDRMRRFEQEARAASGLNHPNIITIHEIDQSGPTSFIATEFIAGSTLRERMRGQPLAPADALGVAVQIAAALAAAHDGRIVHRDIKPDNVIVRSDGIVKVLDFGLATLTGERSLGMHDGDTATRTRPMTDSGVVLGTATYMSPEQARGQRVDARTDIFSLGVVLYELLTGHLPFEGKSIYETMAAVLSDQDAPPLSRYAAGMPAELERIVGKALRKNKDERYQTSKDLLLDLQTLQQRLAFEKAHPAGSTGVDPHIAPSRAISGLVPRGLLAVACGVLLLVAGVAAVWWRQAHVPGQLAIRSLAVLPLKSLNGGENYLGLGIADAAIRRISQTGKVIVRPTSAVRRYLNEDTDALSACRQLGADSVLEGSLQRAEDRLRVSINFLRCQDGVSLWSDSFDIGMADIFTVQDTVAQQVASRLRFQMDVSQQAQLTKRYTSNPVAYEFYLKGTYSFDQRMGDPGPMLDRTISFYRQAIEADPNFALAHAQLAFAYARLGVFIRPTQPEWIAHAREEIAIAERLDPQLAETHIARFQLLYSEFEGYQADAAAREVLLANQLNPNVGHGELAYLYNHLGLEDLAARELALAREIDPTSESRRETALLMYEVQSRYDDYAADQTVRHDGRIEALYLIAKGRFAEAHKVLDEWSKKPLDNKIALPPTQALLLAAEGRLQEAEAAIPDILGRHPLKDPLYHHAAYDIACIYALEGKSAEAVKWLRESAVTGFHLYPRYTRDALLDRIRQSPEFIQFLAEMKAENDRYRREFS